MVVDAETGKILTQTNADSHAFPASLTKLMTLYLTFTALNHRQLALDDRLPVSPRAAAQEPTKLGLKPGEKVSVRHLILGLVTRSANDAAVVLAEAQAGSEEAFAERMTAMAHRLGMRHTVYRNASGLPDSGQYTTARDLVRLALALYRNFPREYEYFSVRKFEFRGETVSGHNHLLDWYKGADGLKTGFIRASGFNLAASAERDDNRLVGVILGSPTWQSRDRQMGVLLDRGFAALAAEETSSSDTILRAENDKANPRSLAKLAVYLSPTTAAHAASPPKPAARGRSSDAEERTAGSKSIQVGTFRTRAAARSFARAAARLPVAKGRTVRIMPPRHGAAGGMYRVVVSQFTQRDAERVCARLVKTTHCMVVHHR